MATALMVFAILIFCIGIVELTKSWRSVKADLLIIGGTTLFIVSVVVRVMGIAE